MVDQAVAAAGSGPARGVPAWRRAALGAAWGGGSLSLLGLLSWGVLTGEARYARRTVPVLGAAPPAAGRCGEPAEPALRVAVLGDSSAAGLGVTEPAQTPGRVLAAEIVARGRAVDLDVLAFSGARSADLAEQVRRALAGRPELAVISVGTNDVTHKVPATRAAAQLAAAVRELRTAGASVVVATCPDLGVLAPLPPPLRWVAARRGRRLARLQEVAVAAAGGRPVPIGRLLGGAFRADRSLFCHDRFHPSAAGYRQLVAAVLPEVLAAAGLAQ